jgi:hypothetical protein
MATLTLPDLSFVLSCSAASLDTSSSGSESSSRNFEAVIVDSDLGPWRLRFAHRIVRAERLACSICLHLKLCKVHGRVCVGVLREARLQKGPIVVVVLVVGEVEGAAEVVEDRSIALRYKLARVEHVVGRRIRI